MKATIKAENDEYDYEITLTNEFLENDNFVDLMIRQDGEDYYEIWTVNVRELYDLVSVFNNRIM